jgi:hypothetical protein
MLVGGLKEAAQGLQSGCGAPPENEGKDPGISWIQEDVGCRLQEGVPPHKSGMVKKKPHQENLYPGKVWTAKGFHCRWNKDDMLCKSGMAQRTQL